MGLIVRIRHRAGVVQRLSQRGNGGILTLGRKPAGRRVMRISWGETAVPFFEGARAAAWRVNTQTQRARFCPGATTPNRQGQMLGAVAEATGIDAKGHPREAQLS